MPSSSATRSSKIAAEKAGILKRGVPAVDRGAAARGAGRRSSGRPRAMRAPLQVAGEDWTRDRGARPAGLSGRRRACSTCRRRSSTAAISSRTPASRSRRCARPGLKLPARGVRGRHRQRRLAGAHAAAHRRDGSPRLRRRGASCGSTAATMPTAAAPSPARSPISRSACRARSCSIVGMLATKDRDGVPAEFRRARAPRRSRCRSRVRTKALPADAIAAAARAVGIPARCGDDIEAALAAIGSLGLDPPPRILITGSLYLAGEVLAANGTPPV